MSTDPPNRPPGLAAAQAASSGGNASCVLTRELRIVETNAAWTAFAEANGGAPAAPSWAEGASLLDAIAEPLRAFYVRGFEATHTSGQVWEHDYDCSTPDRYRVFRMIAYPAEDYFVVSHAPVIERPHDREVHAPSEAYRERGLITMCCHCRRVRAAVQPPRWDWVPAWVDAPPPRVSHGLCPPCYYHHYGDDD